MPKDAKSGQQKESGNQDYFSLKELADYSRIGVKKLKEAIDRRELLCAFPGSKAIISRKDFEDWFKKQKTKPAPDVELTFERERQKTDLFSFD